jgi:hypothetical protein
VNRAGGLLSAAAAICTRFRCICIQSMWQPANLSGSHATHIHTHSHMIAWGWCSMCAESFPGPTICHHRIDFHVRSQLRPQACMNDMAFFVVRLSHRRIFLEGAAVACPSTCSQMWAAACRNEMYVVHHCWLEQGLALYNSWLSVMCMHCMSAWWRSPPIDVAAHKPCT